MQQASDDPATGLRRAIRQQKAVADLGRLALGDAELRVVMDAAVEAIAGALEVDHATVMELAPHEDIMRLRSGVGWRESVVGAEVDAMPGGYVAFTLASEQPVVVEDLPHERRFEPSPILLDHGVIASLAVRIPGERERPFGVIGVHSTRERRWEEAEVEFMRGVAAVLSTRIAAQRRAIELNDSILQGLSVASYALRSGAYELAAESLDGALRRARSLVSELLGGGEHAYGPDPGDLRRAEPARVTGDRGGEERPGSPGRG